jgi:hypothetical protein
MVNSVRIVSMFSSLIIIRSWGMIKKSIFSDPRNALNHLNHANHIELCRKGQLKGRCPEIYACGCQAKVSYVRA